MQIILILPYLLWNNIMSSYLVSTATNKRLQYIGLFAALLAWAVAVVEIVAPSMLWLLNYPQILNGYLNSYAAQMPILASPGYQVSGVSMSLIFLLEMILNTLLSIAFGLTGLFFMRFSRGEIWVEFNVKIVWSVGVLFIITPLLVPVFDTLKGLALAIDVPAGQKSISMDIGFSSKAIYGILQGIFLCCFSLLIAEAKKINDENRSFI